MKWNLPVSHVRSTKISILIILFYMSECIAYGRHIIITELIYLILLVFSPSYGINFYSLRKTYSLCSAYLVGLNVLQAVSSLH